MNKIKIPTIPPIIVNGLFETDFQRKASHKRTTWFVRLE